MIQQLAEDTKTQFRSCHPFGCEVIGLTMSAVANETIDTLKLKLAEGGVAVIRDQAIDDADFANFLQRLGTLTFTTGERPVENNPLLNVVTNVGRTRPPRSVFHTDTSYVCDPPSYTALRAIALPKTGGETLFCNQYRAFDRLPAWVKEKLRSTKVLHVVSGLTLGDDDEQQTWHPLFRRHPISEKISLFLSTPERCVALSGFSADESSRIIQLLYRHSIRPAHLYRHHWRAGDVVVWDNRCTMHRADHSRVVGDRTLHRGLVAGEAPIPL